MSYISAHLRRFVVERAGFACEYCQLPDSLSFYPHEVDHIIALKHNGKTGDDNLAYACWRCNRFKGSDLGSFDPSNGNFSFLFHPRKQLWKEHFSVVKGRILGKSSEGRTTASLLRMNEDERVRERIRYLT